MVMYNSLHEIKIYHSFQMITKGDILSLLQLIECVDSFLNEQRGRIHPVYFFQIGQLCKIVESKVVNTSTVDVYELKDLVANLRDLAILLSTQQFDRQNVLPCNEAKRLISFGQIFNRVMKKTLPYSFVLSNLESLSKVWNSEVSNQIEVNRKTSFLDFPFVMGDISSHDKDYLDYLLLFFEGFAYGSRNLFKDLSLLKEQHKDQYQKYSTEFEKEGTCAMQNTNFIYSCLFPFLDNVGIISLYDNMYSLFLRALRCLFVCAGSVEVFYGNLSKYGIQLPEANEAKLKVKNEEMLKKIMSGWSSKMYISRSILRDLCHFFGYDNLWIGSKIHSQILISLISEDMKGLCSGIGNQNALLLQIGNTSNFFPNNMQYQAPSFCILLNKNDVCTTLKQLYVSFSSGIGMAFEDWYLNFNRQLLEIQRDFHHDENSSDNCQINYVVKSVFEGALFAIKEFLTQDRNFSSNLSSQANLDLSKNDKEESVSVSFTVYPYQHMFVKQFTKCTLKSLLLLGSTICSLQEGLMGHLVETFVRNIPSLQTITHWVDKSSYQSVDIGNLQTNDVKVTKGVTKMLDILSLPCHEEWTPILVGLLHALSVLVCATGTKTNQWRTFYKFIDSVFTSDADEENFNRTGLKNDILKMRYISSKPAKQIFIIYGLFMRHNKMHYFIPLLRSASLFYGGIVLLRKVKQCLPVQYHMLEKEPSRHLEGGFRELKECFENKSDMENVIKMKFSHFLGHELFTKCQNTEIICEWDFSYPFVSYLKRAEQYSHVVNQNKISWVK